MRDIKSLIMSQSTAVRTLLLPEVKAVCDRIVPQYDTVGKYQTNIKEWLLPMIDLRDYYVYPMNGITEGLNWWYNRETRTVDMANGDYQWITRTGSDMLYVSTPSSIDGNMHAINDNRPIALDLAYVGSTSLHTISNRNVERAFFSLSKPFGVRNIRTGWYFTKQLDQKLEDLVGSAKYYNYYASDVAEAIIENFAIDYVYNKLHNQQRTYCELLDLTPSDSVWLGTGTQEEYAKFRRQGNIARVCLAGLYEHES